MGCSATWHVVYTRPLAEAQASASLRRGGYETLFLHCLVQTRHARRERIEVRAYFPRYVFLAVDAHQGLYAANKALGVVSVLACADERLVVPEAVIAELRSRGDANGMVKAPPEAAARPRLAAGQRVQVVGGPFAGFMAAVELDQGPEIVVWLEQLHHRLRVSLPVEALSP